MRRGGRAAEGARLESVFTGNRNEGSNPSFSAIFLLGGKILFVFPTAAFPFDVFYATSEGFLFITFQAFYDVAKYVFTHIISAELKVFCLFDDFTF